MARILVIEDDQRIRELVCQHLSENGHSVTSKTTGLEGLKAATEQKPELLVLDLGLPDLDGLDLIKMIRGVADFPVLVGCPGSIEDVSFRVCIATAEIGI